MLACRLSGSILAHTRDPPVPHATQPGDNKWSALTTDHGGWLLCDGRTLLKARYPDLSTVLGIAFSINGSAFRLPDVRGRVVGMPNPTAGINMVRSGP